MMYLAAPLVLGLSACSVTRNMVFVNSSKDLEYRINASNMTEEAIKNVQRGVCHINKDYVSTPYLGMKLIPYQSLGMGMNKPYKYEYRDFHFPKK
jgi:hypothetical protein